MTSTAPAEVTEADAVGGVADAYGLIRSALRSTFVPTIYRRLAVHPEAFAIAVAGMPDIVRVGDDTGFVELACDAARELLAQPEKVGKRLRRVVDVALKVHDRNDAIVSRRGEILVDPLLRVAHEAIALAEDQIVPGE